MTRLSCHQFRSNEVQFWLSILAGNLSNLWLRPALLAGISDWSLTCLQQRLVKTGETDGEACAVLLAVTGGGTSDANTVLGDVA